MNTRVNKTFASGSWRNAVLPMRPSSRALGPLYLALLTVLAGSLFAPQVLRVMPPFLTVEAVQKALA